MAAVFEEYCQETIMASGDSLDCLKDRKIRSLYHNNFMSFKPPTTSFCRPAGHVICGSNAKANTRVTVRAKGAIQQLTCVWRVRPPNGQLTIVSDNPLGCSIEQSGFLITQSIMLGIFIQGHLTKIKNSRTPSAKILLFQEIPIKNP